MSSASHHLSKLEVSTYVSVPQNGNLLGSRLHGRAANAICDQPFPRYNLCRMAAERRL